jgi:hypothetical protein
VQDYCCYCLDDLGVIRSIEVICAEADEQATRLAIEILEKKSACVEIDLWGSARRIHVLRRECSLSRAASSAQIVFLRATAEKS